MKHLLVVALVLVAGAALAQESKDAAPNLSLTCNGAMRGTFLVQSNGGAVFDNQGNSLAAHAGQMRYQEVPTIAEFQLEGGKARLNLPQPPTCGICSGEKGWRDVKDLQVGPNRITGRISYGMFSGAKFEIDRRTGTMTSTNGFRGECAAQDLSARKF